MNNTENHPITNKQKDLYPRKDFQALAPHFTSNEPSDSLTILQIKLIDTQLFIVDWQLPGDEHHVTG